MRVAIYARGDQIALARARADKEGWTVVEVYSDAAISGSFLHTRPGLLDMMVAAKEGRIDAVLTESLDRLSRDQSDMIGLHKRLTHWGIKIITLSDGEVNKLHVGIKSLVNSIFLDDLAQKTRRGQLGRVREGRFPGGRCYGYDNVPGDASKRVINEAQAAIVRRIYQEYVDGRSPFDIAAQLNAEGVPSPFGGQWNASTINGSRARASGIISNPLYAGRPVWNRQRFVKDPETGKRTPKINPQSEWIEVHVPELAIVDDELFAAAMTKRTRFAGKSIVQRRRPKHLLSGLVHCGCCGGAMIVAQRERFGCSNAFNKGTCENRRPIRIDEIQERVLAVLKAQLLAPDVVAAAVEAYRERRRELATAQAGRRRQAQKDLATVDRKIAGVISAIEAGGDPRALAQRLNAREAERREIVRCLPEEGQVSVVELHPRAADRYRAKVVEIQEALASGREAGAASIAAARELIDRIVVKPGAKYAPQGLELTGNLAVLLADDPEPSQSTVLMVAGGGLEPPT